MPKISIIVPIYNIEKYITICVDSVLNQTFNDFELLLIDDGSNDESGKICEEYKHKDSRIKVFHKKNGGLTSARNFGLDQAQGEWICHIDGDDWISTDYLEKLIFKSEQCEADVVICDLNFAYDKSLRPYTTYSWGKNGIDGLAEYISSGWTTLCGSICKKEIYLKNGFKSPEGINYCEDFHLMVRLLSKCKKVAKVNEPLYFYRQRQGSILHNSNSFHKTEKDELWVYSNIIEYLKQEGIYENLRKSMGWRSLKASQEIALDPKRCQEFKGYNPDKNKFIISCPFINVKQKIIMWCLVHNLSSISRLIIYFRNFIGR